LVGRTQRLCLSIGKCWVSVYICFCIHNGGVRAFGAHHVVFDGYCCDLFHLLFFQRSDRVIPNYSGCVVSPADGKVIWTGLVDNSRFYEGSCIKVSIFMSIFNVHVNRVPHEGQVKRIHYYPGKFFSANLNKASKHNEHNAIFIETKGGKKICAVQIAGLIARRIICKLQEGDTVIRGQRFGLICFGSRLDVYLPPELNLKVAVGDKLQAGTSVLGDLI
jgi:phosphatidylserine decarboxylase